MEPVLNFHYGTMGCGKSTYILQMRHTLEREGFRVMLAKPFIDTRDPGVIRSRIGIEYQAIPINSSGFLEKQVDILSGLDYLLVDEAQFLTEDNIEDLVSLVDDHSVRVEAFGLRTDYTGKLFPATATLMALADNLIELPMTYKDGRKAIMHLRSVGGSSVFEGDPIFVGDIDDVYESVSRKMYMDRKGVNSR